MYLLVNKSYVLDYDTWKLLPRDKMPRQSTCYVPSLLWTHKGRDTYRSLVGFGKFNTYKLTPVMQLHGMTVQTGSDHAVIRIQTKNGIKEFYLHWTFGVYGQRGIGNFEVLDKVTYDIRSGEDVNYHMCTIEHIFDFVDGLSKADFEQFNNADMQFGISERRFRVIYKEKELNGMTYAFIYGPWAILLSDDMQFDTLVYLAGLRYGTLRIDKIIYTVNTYVLKMMLLT